MLPRLLQEQTVQGLKRAGDGSSDLLGKRQTGWGVRSMALVCGSTWEGGDSSLGGEKGFFSGRMTGTSPPYTAQH